MQLSYQLDRLHAEAKQNRWLRYFSIFCRVGLAAGFIPSGIVKITGERFTSLSSNHPMGHYLEALHHTGYYYTFIGIAQVTAAILLLIPRTVVLGSLLYLPIILNICILSLAVRFEGSLISSPLMVLAVLFLLCWNYDKIKYLPPFGKTPVTYVSPTPKIISNRFPLKFFAGATVSVALIILVLTTAYKVMPRNTPADCIEQFKGTNRTKAGAEFCDCIHKNGQPLDKCLDRYKKAADDIIIKP